jgi:hypothetical protein
MVLRAERACIGSENDIQIPLLQVNVPVVVNDLTRVFRRLIEFTADVKRQQPGAREFPVGAGLDIRMEGYDIAPVCRDPEHVGNAAEGIIEDPVDIHMHPVVPLKRLQKERKAKAGCLQFGHVPVIGIEQNVFVLPMLFDRRSGAGRKKNRSRDHGQEEFRRVSALMQLMYVSTFCSNDPGMDEILQPPDK